MSEALNITYSEALFGSDDVYNTWEMNILASGVKWGANDPFLP